MPDDEQIPELRRVLKSRTSQLRAVNEEMTQLLDLKNRFLNLATHDIRTPVTTMKLILDLLRKQFGEDAAPGIERLFDILRRNIARMEAKIDEFLLIARLDLQSISLSTEPTDINAVAQEVIAAFFPSVMDRNIVLDVNFGDVPILLADPRRIGQLLSELMTCSLDRLDTGLRMIVWTKSDAEGVHLGVTDYGPPMPPDRPAFLLQGLEKDEPGPETSASLFAASRIARAHGGAIDIRSDEDAGTSFIAILPSGQSASTGESA